MISQAMKVCAIAWLDQVSPYESTMAEQVAVSLAKPNIAAVYMGIIFYHIYQDHWLPIIGNAEDDWEPQEITML